ncbi:unnamed protein product [Mytilus edulis]|uniref:Uncharacterized protein n=1 Tax=Mytilus edulis TaxID=6550 RepID=A0A8S3T677_MYTED|nr:unnamed protein product [Mytilus edulis]
MTLEMEIQNSSKASICYSTIENGRLNHKRIRTNLTGDLYTTEDILKFVLNDHSCSGTIHSFCRFENTADRSFHCTYDCCTGQIDDKNNKRNTVIGADGCYWFCDSHYIRCNHMLCLSMQNKNQRLYTRLLSWTREADNLSVVPSQVWRALPEIFTTHVICKQVILHALEIKDVCSDVYDIGPVRF